MERGQSSEAQPAPTDAALGERLTRLETVVKSLAEVVARLDRRTDETAAAIEVMPKDAESGVASGAQPSDTTVGKAEFEALTQRLATLQQSATSSGRASGRARKTKMLYVWLACLLIWLAVLVLSNLQRGYFDNPPYSSGLLVGP